MSLKRLESLSGNVLNIIVYVQSASLEYHIKTTLKDRYKVHKDFVVSVDTAKALHNAKLDAYVAPLMCEKWLIHVNADKLNTKEVLAGLEKNTSHAITVYWTEKYGTFKQLSDSALVKKQGVYCPVFSFSRLSYGEIMHLHQVTLPKKKYLNKELLDYVCKNYMYDVQAVCDLFAMIKSGNGVESRKDIIENVGAGGNSVSSLTVRILKSHPKKLKGKESSMREAVKLLEDLSYSYSYSTIRKFMLNNLEGFIEMKQLQIMGVYKRPNKEIPEAFDTKRLGMLRRFERVILEEVSLASLLNLKICLLQYNSFEGNVALLQAFSEYFNSIQVAETAT